MLNGPAGMVSEIICNILLAFRNESSFGVSFRKKKIVYVDLTVQRRGYKGWRDEKVNIKE